MPAENQLKETFITLCRDNIKRDGLDSLLDWMERESDFYEAPASTRFHGNHQYGLVEHSLNVYNALLELTKQFHLNVALETLTIVSLFHDLCKANYYVLGTRNVKDKETGVWRKEPFYKSEDQYPVGHGEKSVILLMKHMRLTDDEIYSIRWHMGGFDSAVKGGDYASGKAYEICPLAVLLHVADMVASYLMEGRNV